MKTPRGKMGGRCKVMYVTIFQKLRGSKLEKGSPELEQ
jgi:hypothetical protein